MKNQGQLPAIARIFAKLRSFGLKARLTLRRDAQIAKSIAMFAGTQKDVFLVQIGSNDGKTADPFYKYVEQNGWHCLLVEPVPYVFKRLREVHKHSPNAILENAAVSTRSETRQFYYLQQQSETQLPFWYDQLGSFNREQLLKSKKDIPDIERYIVSSPVVCLSLAQLLDKHKISRMDIFHTDLEGYDSAVLRQLDINKYRPRLILFEHKHLSRSERRATCKFLKNYGYHLTAGRDDTLASLDSV